MCVRLFHYIFGAMSLMSISEQIDQKITITGTSAGGSGCEKYGRVSKTGFENASHLLPFEKTFEVAKHSIACLRLQVAQETFHPNYGSKKSRDNLLVMSNDWKDMVRKPSSY